MSPIILVCFGARLLCLLFLQIDGNLNDAVEKWVVVLFTSTPLCVLTRDAFSAVAAAAAAAADADADAAADAVAAADDDDGGDDDDDDDD